MTALDRAIIKAFHHPSSGSGAAAAEPAAASPHVGASPAVPLSRALAELAASIPPEVETASTDIATEPVAVQPTTAPVGPTIGALLDQATSPDTAETHWHPLLQVDRLVWPGIHARLLSTAPAAIQQMGEGLLSLGTSGSKVLGLASCAGGEGVTTLLTAAARELLRQGRKVVLVDGNWSNPQLAHSLGLLPQIGWEETLCGGLPLEEVVIESLADGLAVLPLRKTPASSIAQGHIAASLDILAREFDVVLVDLGPLASVDDENTFSREGTPSHCLAARMDAIILVQNIRATPPNLLCDVRQRLAASNLRYAGTIQNFVAG